MTPTTDQREALEAFCTWYERVSTLYDECLSDEAYLQITSALTAPPHVPCRVCGHAEPESEYVPPVPDIAPIREVARKLGYAIAIHGSLKRDCDLIAAPWTDAAVPAQELIEAICTATKAHVVGKVENKPHGRVAASIQIDAWCKYIDLSIMPISVPQEVVDALNASIARVSAEMKMLADSGKAPAMHRYARAYLDGLKEALALLTQKEKK